jgi:Ribonuclease G/E
MSKIICIDSFGGNVYAALAENGKLLEFHIEKAGNKKIVGNIYKGRVENVLSGMQAAFVSVGLEKTDTCMRAIYRWIKANLQAVSESYPNST